LKRGWYDVRGLVAVEFALVAAPFLLVLLFVFEISVDLFQQEAMDSALHLAARELQTGNAQNVKDGATFIANYLCPSLGNLLTCNSLYVKVQKISPTSTQDFYNFTTGVLPITAGALDLSSYGSANFCNAGPSELLVVSAIYVSPTIVGGLLPNVLSWSFGGSMVHATLSTVGTVSEGYTATTLSKTSAPAC